MANARTFFLAWLVLIAADPAAAGELKVLAAAAVKSSVSDVAARLEAQGEGSARFTFGTAGAIRTAASTDRTFDVVIAPPAVIADLEKQGLLVAGSAFPVGTVRLGVAAAADSPLPGLDTNDALRAFLVQAPSVAMADPKTGATSGIFLDKLLTTLGIADVVRPKLKLYPEGQLAMEAVAHHEAAVGLGQISEAVPVRGLAPVTPLPEAAQLRTTYVAALSSHSENPGAAKALMATLQGQETKARFRANGFDPGS